MLLRKGPSIYDAYDQDKRSCDCTWNEQGITDRCTDHRIKALDIPRTHQRHHQSGDSIQPVVIIQGKGTNWILTEATAGRSSLLAQSSRADGVTKQASSTINEQLPEEG